MHISQEIYRYVYIASLCVFGVSLLLVILMEGVAPFGLRAAWSEQGVGSALVLTKDMRTPVSEGTQVVASLHAKQQVTMFSVAEVMRRDGELLYATADPSLQQYVHVRDVTGSVAASVPLVGSWIRALQHPIGLAALLGIPVLMLIINFSGIALRRFAHVYNNFTEQIKLHRKTRVADSSEHELPTEAVPAQRAYVQPIAPVSVAAVHDEVDQEQESVYQANEPSNLVRKVGGVLILPKRHYGV